MDEKKIAVSAMMSEWKPMISNCISFFIITIELSLSNKWNAVRVSLENLILSVNSAY